MKSLTKRQGEVFSEMMESRKERATRREARTRMKENEQDYTAILVNTEDTKVWEVVKRARYGDNFKSRIEERMAQVIQEN